MTLLDHIIYLQVNYTIYHYNYTPFNQFTDPLCLIFAVCRTFIAFLVLSIAILTFSSSADFLTMISDFFWLGFGLYSVYLKYINSTSGLPWVYRGIGKVNLLSNYCFFGAAGTIIAWLLALQFIKFFKSFLNCSTVFNPLIYLSMSADDERNFLFPLFCWIFYIDELYGESPLPILFLSKIECLESSSFYIYGS